MAFAPLAKGQPGLCLARGDMPHAYTYVPDAVQALLKLAATASAWNQVWHLPTAPDPPTGKAFTQAAAEAMHAAPKTRVLRPWMVWLSGWADRTVGEVHEMFYQNDAPNRFSPEKYFRACGPWVTPYADGIRATAASYAAPQANS